MNLTVVAPVNLVLVMVTEVLTGPLVGLNEVMVGAPGTVTVKLVALVPVPPEVVTEMGPVVAPVGTVAVIRVLLFTVNVVAETPLNFTEVAPVKPVPVITTDVPTGPLVGLKDVTVGTAAAVTSKLAALVAVPSAFVTEIGPSGAPAGTVVVIVCGLLTAKVAETPLNLTAVTSGSGPVKLSPLIWTDVPMGPLVGVNDEIVGAAA